MPRAAAAVPSYIMVLLIMVVVSSIASTFVIKYFSPLARQEPYLGSAVRYNFRVDRSSKLITVVVTNVKDYDAKVDIMLVDKNGEMFVTCPGVIISPAKGEVVNGTLSLLGIVVKAGETVTVMCNGDFREAKVFEHGADPGGGLYKAKGYPIPGWYNYTDDINLRLPWLVPGFAYRMPVTMILVNNYEVVYGEILISPTTVGKTAFDLIYNNIRSDGKDVVVATAGGELLPTSGNKTSSSIVVIFELRNAKQGVHKLYLYFGNRDVDQEPNPIRSSKPWLPKVTTPQNGLPKKYLSNELVYPAYVLPEGNWYPFIDSHLYGHRITTNKSTVNSWLDAFTQRKYDQANQLISGALSNVVLYPIGTKTSDPNYAELRPKTVLGNAPWATLTVVELPSFAPGSLVVDLTTTMYTASDDGSSSFLVGLRHNQKSVYTYTYHSGITNTHPPRYAGYRSSSSWNYESSATIPRQEIEGAKLYLVVVQQNGVYFGSGPGWLDFRFSMLWVERSSSPGFVTDPIRGDWLNGWSYRKRLTLRGSNLGPLERYVLRVVVRWGSGTDSIDTVYCDKKCRQDFGDVRFTADDGVTILSYCMAVLQSGDYAVFYVMTRLPEANRNTHIYMYYGNPGATYDSDCSSVFGRHINSRYSGDSYYDALILSKREWIGGGSYLCSFTDDGSCIYHLPFSVLIYDFQASCFGVSSNGFVRWDCANDPRKNNYVDKSRRILAPHWDDLVNTYVYVGTGMDAVLGEYTFITWQGQYPNCVRRCSALVQLVLYKNWILQFNILDVSISLASPTEYISAGDGTNYIDLTPRWINMESVIFVPRFPSVYAGWGSEETR